MIYDRPKPNRHNQQSAKKLEKLDKLDSVESSIKEIESTCENIQLHQNTNEQQIEVIQSEVDVLQSEMNRMQYDKIRNNVIIYSVPRLEEENAQELKICNSFLDTALDITCIVNTRTVTLGAYRNLQ